VHVLCSAQVLRLQVWTTMPDFCRHVLKALHLPWFLLLCDEIITER
jgi:hypothetical protein